jgi:hypothetical protein
VGYYRDLGLAMMLSSINYDNENKPQPSYLPHELSILFSYLSALKMQRLSGYQGGGFVVWLDDNRCGICPSELVESENEKPKG